MCMGFGDLSACGRPGVDRRSTEARTREVGLELLRIARDAPGHEEAREEEEVAGHAQHQRDGAQQQRLFRGRCEWRWLLTLV